MPLLASLGAVSARSFGLCSGVVAGVATITSIVGNDNGTTGGQAKIYFTAGTVGSTPVTNYQVSTDNGSTWTTLSPADITSPLVVTGLTNGTTYTVKIRSLQGSVYSEPSNAVTVRPVALPAAPVINSIDDDINGTTGTRLNVYYTKTDGTDTVAHSTMQYSINNGSTWQTRTDGGSASPILITGLTNGTSYNVKVRSITSIGDVSSGSSTVVGRPVKLPGAPTLSAVRAYTGYVYFDFTAGSAGTDTTTNYQYSINNGSTWSSPSPVDTSTPIAVATLGGSGTGFYDENISDGDYNSKFRLRALTSQGHVSSASAAKSPTIYAPSAPPAPTVTATATSLTFSWNASTVGSYAIDHYDDSTNNSTWSSVGITPTKRDITYTGLTPGTSYTRYFRAVDIYNRAGNSVSKSGTTLAETAPSTPSAPKVTAASTTSISVDWSTSTAGTYSISKYQYRYKASGGSYTAWADIPGSPQSDPFTISSLSVDTLYYVQIRAVASTSGTASSESTAGSGTTDPDTPAAPTLSFAATSASERSSASLEWTAPTYATSYDIYKNGVYQKNVTTTSTTVSVSADTENKFKVKAKNRIGGASAYSNEKTMTTGATGVQFDININENGPDKALGLIGSCGTANSNVLLYYWGYVPSSSSTAGYKAITYVGAQFQAYSTSGLLTLSSATRNTYIDVSSTSNRVALTGGLNTYQYLLYYAQVNVSGSSLNNGYLKLYAEGSGWTSYTSSCVPNNTQFSVKARNLYASGTQTTATTYS